MVMQLCERFNVLTQSILASYREYVADPRKVSNILDEVLIHVITNTIAISSSEAERRFSKMNIICTEKTNKAQGGKCFLIDVHFKLRTTSTPVEFREGCVQMTVATSSCPRFSKQKTE